MIGRGRLAAVLATLVVCAAGLFYTYGHDSVGQERSGAADRSGVLAADRRLLRAERLFPFGQPALERERLPARHSDTAVDAADRRRVPRRRPGAELHLRRRASAATGVHRRHPPRQHEPASALQGVHRAVGGSRGFPVAPVRPAAAGGSDRHRRRSASSSMPTNWRRRATTSSGATCRPPRIISSRITTVRADARRCARPRVRVQRVLQSRPGSQLLVCGFHVFGGLRFPTYAMLMTETDDRGEQRSYLATEDNFRLLREMERNNAIVPVTGDFGGPKALRSVGRYLKSHGATVTAFYTSNVEQYLVSAGRRLGAVLRERGDAPDRRQEHVHPIRLKQRLPAARLGVRFPGADTPVLDRRSAERVQPRPDLVVLRRHLDVQVGPVGQAARPFQDRA